MQKQRWFIFLMCFLAVLTSSVVASIGGIQNFASNIAGILLRTFTGLMVNITKGSFLIPLLTAGMTSIILFVVGEIAPLRAAGDAEGVRLSGRAA